MNAIQATALLLCLQTKLLTDYDMLADGLQDLSDLLPQLESHMERMVEGLAGTVGFLRALPTKYTPQGSVSSAQKHLTAMPQGLLVAPVAWQ